MKGIYKITNNITGNFYIGSSNNIFRRFREHKNVAFNIKSKNYKYPIYRAIRKYGIDNFKFEVLEKLNEETDLINREKYWFNKLKPYYNQIEPVKTPGFHKNHTDETKDKISRNNCKYWQGKKLPENMIKSIIEGNKIKRKQIIMKDKNNNVLMKFDGYCNALKYLNKNPKDTGNIKRCCLDENKTAYGYKWSFE